jgi:general secretion pathway protein C
MVMKAVLNGKAFHHNRAMLIHEPNIWWLRTSTLLLAALAAGSATFWSIRWMTPSPGLPSTEINAGSQPLANPLGIARLLGGGRTELLAGAPTGGVASQFKLLGVVASPSERGYALIAVGPLPAKPFRVGDAIDETLILQSVAPRSASLATSRDGPVAQILELPALNPP